jgi:medium-chain acyl-[acyl-carrier-protein] hydrolase
MSSVRHHAAVDHAILRMRAHAHDSGRSRLFVCFHHAGAGASSYAHWPVEKALHADFARVQLKGREDRCADVLDDTLPALADEIATALDRTGHRGLVLFGHSMGATVAWWVAAALWERHGRHCRLVVSAQAPGLPAVVRCRRTGHLRAWYESLGEPWPAVLDDQQMQAIATATLDADIAWMCREFERPLPGPLPLTMDGLAWESDKLVSPAEMLRWQSLIAGRFTLHNLPGGHLELCARPAPALALLQRILDEECDHVRPHHA